MLCAVQSDHSDLSGSESEFEADPEEFAASSSSEDINSEYGSDGSGSADSGSDFGGGDDESDEGSPESFLCGQHCVPNCILLVQR